jgi:hypothetical protein
MIKSTLRLATSAVLLMTAIGASADPATTKPLEITGVLQEQVGNGGGTLTGGEDILTGAGNLKLSGQVSYEEKN